jgi:hypothetical protein
LPLAAFACGTSRPGEWHDEGGYRWRELAGAGRRAPGFTQLDASRTGIDFVNSATELQLSQNRHLGQGSGVALGDADGDGRVDVYFARIDGPNALFHNLGGWRFEEVAEPAGVSAPNRYSTGTAFVDIEGDRDVDLLVTSLGGPNSLFLNDGTGRFVEDLFPPWEREFDRVVRPVDGGFEVASRFRDHYRIEMREDLNLVVRTELADPDWLYLNDGTGRFSQVPLTSGRFLDVDGNPITDEPDYFVLSARFFDADADQDPDLYVAADFEDPDFFWINDGHGVFREVPRLALRTTSNSAMALDISDIDRDGDVDLFEVDMLSRDARRRKTQKPSHTVLPKIIGRIDDRPQMMRNTLFVNRGDETYSQISYLAGIEASDWSWSAVFLDVDLDGYEDLLLSNGHIWDVMDSDIQERLRRSVPGANWRRGRFLYPRLYLENVAFRNSGDLTFEDRTLEWGFGVEEDISHGMALGDLDGDGDLDVVINRFESAAAVYRNDAAAARVAVRLDGEPPNTQGVGAKIRVYGGPVEMQEKEVVVGGLYVSSSDPSYTFATGSAREVAIEVTWRSGSRSVVSGAAPNRLYEIRESGAASGRTGLAASPNAGGARWFSDVSDLLGHAHHETPFDDFGRQPMLPHALSLHGPGTTWYDVDGDGDEDLLIASGSGRPFSYYRNDNGRFTAIVSELPELRYDQTTVLGIPGVSGGTALLVGQSSYEARAAEEVAAVPSVLRVDLGEHRTGRSAGAVVSSAVAGSRSAVGPLALGDYDSDGDLDRFVGGRVRPGTYPVAASSRLFLNDNGTFVEDDRGSTLLDSIGLVSAATFSDVDVDGAPDLVVALDWGSIRLFRNEAGSFTDASAEHGLDAHVSRWNGITTGDLNEDGMPDIVATNWGRNTAHRPSEGSPLLLYHADYDRNGVVDLIEAQYDPVRQAVYPLALFTRIRAAMPMIARHIGNHMEYADATVSDLVGSSGVESEAIEVGSLEHLLFLSDGGSYTAVPLPLEAQYAPAFYAGIADFNGDGHEDLFLAQNFFPTEIETPRYDAGRGLLLVGDGTGNLESVPGQVSGIEVYGDQRGAAFSDYDHDGRVDLVVSQNGAETKLYHNDHADSGIRVRLVGPVENPHGIGASLRLVYEQGLGPAREVHGGTGYWSQNGPVQVMGLGGEVVAVRVRWPGGVETETPVEFGAREVMVGWR